MDQNTQRYYTNSIIVHHPTQLIKLQQSLKMTLKKLSSTSQFTHRRNKIERLIIYDVLNLIKYIVK